ncbi:MAG: alpha/beta hydrolase family protein [Pseudonocardiaceae bacterium]
MKPYLPAHPTGVTTIGSSPDRMPAVIVADIDSGECRELTAAGGQAPDPEVVDVLARDGGRVHATLYRPRPERSPAPVIVRGHPGPTSSAPLRLDPWVQFFVDHGFAVLDVDYRGSTGYGRAYRTALRGHWGVLDVSDCIDAVETVGRDGAVDLDRVVISGASAGGYTALRAATTTTTFRAATVHSAIVDPVAWRSAAPKFQSHHVDLLLGPVDTWRDRSLIRPGIAAHCPILAFHSDRDTVTPLRQVRELVAALGDQLSLVVYPDEGHGLSRPGNIPAAMVTSGVVNDVTRRRTWEVDLVVAPADGRVLALGEAKWGQVMDIGHLERLRRIRQLLVARDRDGAGSTRLLCFSATGFTAELAAAERDGQLSCIGLDRLHAAEKSH